MNGFYPETFKKEIFVLVPMYYKKKLFLAIEAGMYDFAIVVEEGDLNDKDPVYKVFFGKPFKGDLMYLTYDDIISEIYKQDNLVSHKSETNDGASKAIKNAHCYDVNKSFNYHYEAARKFFINDSPLEKGMLCIAVYNDDDLYKKIVLSGEFEWCKIISTNQIETVAVNNSGKKITGKIYKTQYSESFGRYVFLTVMELEKIFSDKRAELLKEVMKIDKFEKSMDNTFNQYWEIKL